MAKTSLSFVSPDAWRTDEGLVLLEGWARDGYKFKDIATMMCITEKQLAKWRDDYPDIQEALRKGREVIDYKVESALLKAALGYKTKETTIISVLQNGHMVDVEKQVVEKDVSPSVSACQAWLYNRLPDKWKNMNSRTNIIKDLAEENNNISITITRAGKRRDRVNKGTNENGQPLEEYDEEWESEVNHDVTLTASKKKTKKKMQGKEWKVGQEGLLVEEENEEEQDITKTRNKKKPTTTNKKTIRKNKDKYMDEELNEELEQEEQEEGGLDVAGVHDGQTAKFSKAGHDLDYWPDDWQDEDEG